MLRVYQHYFIVRRVMISVYQQLAADVIYYAGLEIETFDEEFKVFLCGILQIAEPELSAGSTFRGLEDQEAFIFGNSHICIAQGMFFIYIHQFVLILGSAQAVEVHFME